MNAQVKNAQVKKITEKPLSYLSLTLS